MSYDRALERLRQRPVDPPRFTEVEQRRRWKADRALPLRRVRIAMVATAVAMAGYLGLTIRPLLMLESAGVVNTGMGQIWRVSIATLVPAVLLGWALALLRRQGVGPQMLARAIWWSNLVVGTLIAGNFMTQVDRLTGAGIAVACAVALLSLGSRGLDHPGPDDPFQPVRFRGQLLLALVMAFADAQTLVFSAVMQLRVGMQGWNLADTISYAGPATLAAAVMVITVWGVYRLRTWALLLNLLANFAIAYLAMGGVLHVAGPVALALAATAAVQAFLPVPILAMALGEKRAGQPLLRGHAPRLLPVSVVLIALLALGMGIVPMKGSGWLTGPGRSFRRGIELDHWAGRRIDLSNEDLSGQDLSKRRLTHAILRRANLRGATGRVRLNSAILIRADLRDAQFADSDLTRAHLEHANLQGIDLQGAKLYRANLRHSNLRDARLEGADLRRAEGEGADLRGANLHGALLADSFHRGTIPIQWEGATCPDGATADPMTGCDGHLGQIAQEDHERFEGIFEQTHREWDHEPRGCYEGPALRKAVVSREHILLFMDELLVQSGEDHFVSRHGELQYERHGSEVTVTYRRRGCGELRFVRVR